MRSKNLRTSCHLFSCSCQSAGCDQTISCFANASQSILVFFRMRSDHLTGWLLDLLPFPPSDDCCSSWKLNLFCITDISLCIHPPRLAGSTCSLLTGPSKDDFHLCGFSALSVGQAAAMRLRLQLFTKEAAFLDFQQLVPHGLLEGNLRAD